MRRGQVHAPVCIAGMHRAGTSVVTQLLHLSGLYLGREGELMPATADNPDGFWEHTRFVELNDRILGELGGGWDCPPSAGRGWPTRERFHSIRARAQELVQEFRGHRRWGWKDPRNSLTLPFWNHMLPGLKVVVCVRSPLEVALSLRRRNFLSYTMSLRLWKAYYEAILATVPAKHRVFTHYTAYFDSPSRELRRVLTMLDVKVSSPIVERACDKVLPELRHHRFTDQNLAEAGVSGPVVRLYAALCREAGRDDGEGTAARKHSAAPARRGARSPVTLIDVSLFETHLARRDERKVEQQSAGRHADVDRLAGAERDRDTLRASPNAAQADSEELERSRRCECLGRIEAIRDVARAILPAGQVVLVVSKGDDQLLQLDGCAAWHFPQSEDAKYAGHHPAGSHAAIGELEKLREKGAGFLLFPASAFWWLDHYAAFRGHLERSYRSVHRSEICAIYALGDSSRWRQVADLVANVKACTSRYPAILNWSTGVDLGRIFPECPVFAPIDCGGDDLPYMSHTIEIVAVSTDVSRRLEEAHRLASEAVLMIERVGDDPEDLNVVIEPIQSVRASRVTSAAVRTQRAAGHVPSPVES